MSEPQGMSRRKRRYLTAAAYLVISGVSSSLFALAASGKGSSTTDIGLGVVWVFALSAIVSASLLPQLLERKFRKASA